MVDDLREALADLSPEQRALLQLRLRRIPEDWFPLSFTQEQLWFLDQLEPGSSASNVSLALRIEGPLQEMALARSLDRVVQRHEALRTVFAEHDGQVRQRVSTSLRICLTYTDLRDRSPAERVAGLAAASAAQGATAFDLRTGPLVAAELVALTDTDHQLLVTAHHIVFDAWSADVLTRDLFACYAELTGAAPAELPPLRSRFADHVRSRRTPEALRILQRDLDHWGHHLAGLPLESTLPPDRPRPPVQSHRGRRHQVTLSPELTGRLDQLARSAGVSLNAVLLAGFAASLRRYNGQDDLALGMPTAGRPRTELEPLIGSFASMLVLRLDLSGPVTARELLVRTHRAISTAARHQEAPYAHVVERTGVPRDPRRNPLFQVLVTVGVEAGEPPAGHGLSVTPVAGESEVTDFDLFAGLTRRGDRIDVVLDHNTDLYLDETVEGFLATLVAGLSDLAEHPDTEVASLPSLAHRPVALAATFTADLVREPLDFWLRFKRLPLAVAPVAYGRLIHHLLDGDNLGGGVPAATICLLRWADWLRHRPDATLATAARLLDSAMSDLEAAVAAHRRRTGAPLLLVVGPPSGSWQRDPAAAFFGPLDDRLALLAARWPGVDAIWPPAEYPDGPGHVTTDVFDDVADRLGHVPYTPEYSAELAARLVERLQARSDTGIGGQPEAGATASDERTRYAAEELATPAAVLARLTSTAPRPSRAFVPPSTDTQRRLAAIWARLLHVDELSVTADFFSLGGHSLLATQVLSAVQAEFGTEISLYALFTDPTVEKLAAVIDAGADGDDGPGRLPLRPAPPDDDPVASSTQERLWALAQLDDDVVRHNTTFAARLTGPVDVAALRRAVVSLVRRHEMLRTTFTAHAGRPVPVPHEVLDCWVEPADLSGLPTRRRALAERRAVDGMVGHAYDLRTGPLLRVQLVATGPRTHLLLVGLHHIVCDNTSWSIVLDELAALYNGHAADTAPDLPDLPLRFTDFARHQHDLLTGDGVRPLVDYWRDQLAGAPVLDVPADHPRPSQPSYVAGHHARRLPGGTASAVRALARAAGVTPFTVLMAAFAVQLLDESGQPDVVVGVPNGGRDRPELANIVGCFTDLLPFRLDLAGRPSFRQLLQRVHGTGLGAYRHQDLPFARIVEALRLSHDSTRHPLFSCVFNLLDLVDEPPRLAGVEVEPLETGSAGADFDLFLTMTWADDELQADLSYSADLFTAERTSALLDRFIHRLAGLLADPDQLVSDADDGPDASPTDGTSAVAVSAKAGGPLVVAGSSDPARLLPTLRFWSGLLGPVVEPAMVPGRAPVRALLQADSAFGADPEGLNALAVRWRDWLPDLDLDAPTSPVVAARRLEGVVRQLTEAVAGFRRRTPAGLLVVVDPLLGAEPVWSQLGADLVHRLRRATRDTAGVTVVSLSRWADRYQAGEDAGLRDTVLATLIARHADAGRPRPATIVLAADCNPDVVLAAARTGRRVVIAAGDAEVAGPVRALADAGLTEIARIASEGTNAGRLVLPSMAVEEADRLWLLDPAPPSTSGPATSDPATSGPATSGAAATAVPGPEAGDVELYLELAQTLATAESITTATEFGYRRAAERAAAAPRTDRERALAAIWADLLHLPDVGVHDNFLDLGGDSLLAMKLVFRAAEAGIRFTPRTLVAHPTIADLCALDDGAAAPGHDPGDERDPEPAPVTPAQAWFLSELAPTMHRPDHFNHPYYLELTRSVAPHVLAEAVARLAERHAALRVRFIPGPAEGAWRQWAAPPSGLAVPFGRHDLPPGLDPAQEDGWLAEVVDGEQRGLDLRTGPTVRVAHLRLGAGRPDRLLVVAHHLAVDAVSRGILLDDLRAICERLVAGEPLPARPTATPYLSWARRLPAQADQPEVQRELDFWLAQDATGTCPLPAEQPRSEVRLGRLDALNGELTEAETAALHDAARRLRTSVRDLLVWAVAATLVFDGREGEGGSASEEPGTGDRECAIATTGHGREALFDDADVSATVGWFQVLYPVRLRLDDDGPDGAVQVAQQLDRVPGNGIGYGLLRYGSTDPDVRRRLAERAAPEVAVNYMGDFGFAEVGGGEELFRVCPDSSGSTDDGTGRWPFRLDVTAALTAGRLQVELAYGTDAFTRSTAERLLAGVTGRLHRLGVPRRSIEDLTTAVSAVPERAETHADSS
jgi:non-ribosomal peptide synthase protein (TIGR01720 family)